MNTELQYGLEKLEMIDPQGKSCGLAAVIDAVSIDIKNYSPEEIIAIENASDYGANYVYFRRFKNRPSIPQVYIYDLTQSSSINNEDLIKLHKRLYSSGLVPIFFVFTKKDLRIFNCYDKPARGNELIYKPLETLSLAAEVVNLFNENETPEKDKFKAFSGKLFDNGSFWENSPYSKEFNSSNSAYEKLLTELKQALKDIIVKKILPAAIARKIMVISILIKYLEERTDEHENSVFPKAGQERILVSNGKRQKNKYEKSFFEQFSSGATCFTDVLKEKGASAKLFDYLAKHFNGGVFQLTEKEKHTLEKSDLSRFGLFLEGKLEGIQYVFWRLYSFNDLPVELISNIYEEFLEKSPGVVYTPPYLVNFLLDETMPFSKSETNFKVLDPACGSGVFLVGAYRRLIYRWRQNNKWKKPNLSTLKKLLKDNIFGSDKDPDAVNLTIFSLSLALCDELTPLQIWENLEFDALENENLYADDFFNLLQSNKFTSETFDLVIGNPPFIGSGLTKTAGEVDKKELKNRILLTNEKSKVSLPRGQIALLFLEQSVQLCKLNGLVCLIQSSAPFLYNKSSSSFRQYMFERFHIPQIIDFSHIARVLFGTGGDVPTAAVFIQNKPSEKKGVLHITVRRTKTHKEKLYFELDSYDFHHVPWRLATYDPYIWKANYLGGGRNHLLIKKIIANQKLKNYLLDQGWEYGAGFRVGNKTKIQQLNDLLKKNQHSSSESKVLEFLRKKYSKSSFLNNTPYLSTDGLTNKGITTLSIKKTPFKYFENVKNVEVYKKPHLLIKEGISNDRLILDVSRKDLCFQEKIIGIHCKPRDFDKLIKLKTYLSSSVVSYFLAGTSAEYQLRRSTSLKKYDIDNIPIIDNIEENLTQHDKILIADFFNHLVEFRSKGENSKVALNNATTKNLEQFAEIFCEVLNSVYSTLKPHVPFETESYICFPFYFEKKPNIKFQNTQTIEKEIEALVIKETGVSLRLTRVIRLYESNIIYLIKPKKLRYWLQSIALRDADETFADLRKQGF